jgi:HAMP domain-containing protein
VISRFQTILFAVLVLASAIMGFALWRQLERAHQRLLAGGDSAPTQAPQVAPAEQATLIVANDTDGSLLTEVQSLPLPKDPGARARAVLGKLLDLYAAPDAAHPVPGGAPSVAQVFLMPAPSLTAAESKSTDSGPQLAVVNFAASFAATHPSGIETETLTVLSICETLHANFPRITQVRFLVDGQPRSTLAGHADLSHTHLASEPLSSAEHQQ